MNNLALQTKLEVLSPNLQKEVADFVDFLFERSQKTSKKKTAKFGCAKGKIRMSPDFDAPLEDFKD